MENAKAGNNEETKPVANVADGENPNLNTINTSVTGSVEADAQERESENVAVANGLSANQRTRTPFTNLSQVDADLALARTLQEQERAYMMLRMNVDGWEAGTYAHEDDDEDEDEDEFDDPSEEEYDGTDADEDDNDEDAFDAHAHTDDEENSPAVELDPSAFPNDEAYARALQDAEDREMAARLLALAGINEMVVGEDEDSEDHGGNSQDAWEEVDPDELSYEELIALGEVVGTESRGLSADTIASLPSDNYKSQGTEGGSSDSCVICRLEYEDGDSLTVLSCKHLYHPECINNWLQINKVCPVCNAEVSTSGNSSS